MVYALREMWRHRWQLKELLRHTDKQFSNLLEIDCDSLLNAGTRILVLDFDGVMSWHGATEPLSEVTQWLQQAIASFGQEHIFILSNNPRAERLAYFAKHYPKLRFVSGMRKKPYPDGLKAIADLSGFPMSQIAIVDDRLLTGVLAAILVNCKIIYITKPFISWRHHWLQEAFFWILRKLERAIFR